MTVETVINDGGKKDSRRSKQRSDCVIRSFAIACNLPYDRVYDQMAVLGRRSGNGTAKSCWKKWLAVFGPDYDLEKNVYYAVSGEPRMKLPDFCKLFPTGRYIIQFAGHLSAVIDGKPQDNFQLDNTK